jgi:hypothetical protein
VGFPIRKSLDHSSFAAPQGLSQRTTSFIASQRQGIHRMLLRHLIALMIGVRASKARAGHGHVKTSGRALSTPAVYACRTPPEPRLSPDPWTHSLFTMSNIRAGRSAAARNPLPFRRPDPPLDTAPREERGGAGRDRTDDLMLAKHALSQLSYSPARRSQPRRSGGPGTTRTSDLTLIRGAL